jgi:hypothetical protein
MAGKHVHLPFAWISYVIDIYEQLALVAVQQMSGFMKESEPETIDRFAAQAEANQAFRRRQPFRRSAYWRSFDLCYQRQRYSCLGAEIRQRRDKVMWFVQGQWPDPRGELACIQSQGSG